MTRKSILVVDDVANNALVLDAILSVFDADIVVARTGPEAIEAVKSSVPDLILMDVAMPHMSGIEATRQIRELLGDRKVPVVGISADVTPKGLESIKDARFDNFMSKPVNVEKLQGIVSGFTGLEVQADAFYAG